MTPEKKAQRRAEQDATVAAGRQQIDFAAYFRKISSVCFICEIVAGNPEFAHHIVYEDAQTIAFLNKYPTLRGYVLVCPRVHREQVTSDFTPDEYLALQSVVYRVAEALRRVAPAERIYIASLGSQQGNRHVHWHVAALPPGVPFEDQQLDALDLRRGVLQLTDEETAELAASLRIELGQKAAD